MLHEYSNEELMKRIQSVANPSGHMPQLWQQNIGLIKKIAGQYQGCEDMEDLKQQGYIGLCDAVKGYRPEKGIPFANYAAIWIRQSMKRYIENSGNVVRIPVYKQEIQRRYKRFLHNFEIQTGGTPSDYEICHCIKIKYSDFQDIRDSIQMKRPESLDSYISEDDSIKTGNMVPDDADIEDTVLSEVENEEFALLLWPMVDELPEEQGKIIRLLYREEKSM